MWSDQSGPGEPRDPAESKLSWTEISETYQLEGHNKIYTIEIIDKSQN